MKRFKAIAGITAVFVIGVMAGTLGTGIYIKHRIETYHEKDLPPIRPMFMKRIGNRLDLTPAQRVEVDKIIDKLQVELKDLRHEFHPKIKAAFDNCFDEMKIHLTEPQIKKLEILKEQLPKRFPHGKGFKRHRKKHRDHPEGMNPPQEDGMIDREKT